MPAKLTTTPAHLQPINKVSMLNEQGAEYAYTVEAEFVGRRIPRPAALAKGTTNTRRLFWNMLLVCIGLIGFLWRRGYDTWDDLIAHGVVTQATVYKKLASAGRWPAYNLCYRFRTDVNTIATTQEVTEEQYKKTRIGARLPVTYLPKRNGGIWQPGIASARQRDLQSSYWFGAALLVALGCGSAIYASKVQSLRELRLLRAGVAVCGQVQSGAVIRGKQNLYLLRYKYGIGNSTCTDEMKVTAKQYRTLTQGNPYFTVLYDAGRPTDNMPYFQITHAYLIGAK